VLLLYGRLLLPFLSCKTRTTALLFTEVADTKVGDRLNCLHLFIELWMCRSSVNNGRMSPWIRVPPGVASRRWELGVRGNWAGKNHSRRIRSVTKEVTLAKNHHLPFMSPQQRTSCRGDKCQVVLMVIIK